MQKFILILFSSLFFALPVYSQILPSTSPSYRELVLTEIFADELPRVELPAAEFVEVYNTSNRTLTLKGCVLTDLTTQTVLPDYLLPSHTYLILCKSTYKADFQVFGQTLGLTSFPSLNNTGDDLRLYAPTGQLIDRVVYAQSWYRDSEKAQGGWSLEQIDVTNACGEETNWTASVHEAGGTPGQLNSVASSHPDLTPPTLLRADLPDATHIRLLFDEKLDTTSTSKPSQYLLEPTISITSAVVQPPTYREVVLTTAAPLQPKNRYLLSIQSVADCNLNRITTPQTAILAIAESAQAGDVVINEVLFNPRTDGVDFVELYNQSDKFISIKDWSLANQADGVTTNLKRITSSEYLLTPKSYAVVTTSGQVLATHYPKSKPETFILLPSLPSYPDDAGTVVLLNHQSQEMDGFTYAETMHFPLLQNTEGVSLERIHSNMPTSLPQNWHSAAATEGYATPGYHNSQATETISTNNPLHINPSVITPNEDGYHDFATIQYSLPTPGNVATVTIFDIAGREICQLATNQTLATEGFFTWDGTNAHGQKVRTGRYIIVLQVFHASGHQQKFKEDIVVSW